ncbi:hypothetical protein SNEBB_006605 [Seison nebaliae]|nr:hypothetical protein SNEBB_006605 [Seison nebaliae]
MSLLNCSTTETGTHIFFYIQNQGGPKLGEAYARIRVSLPDHINTPHYFKFKSNTCDIFKVKPLKGTLWPGDVKEIVFMSNLENASVDKEKLEMDMPVLLEDVKLSFYMTPMSVAERLLNRLEPEYLTELWSKRMSTEIHKQPFVTVVQLDNIGQEFEKRKIAYTDKYVDEPSGNTDLGHMVNAFTFLTTIIFFLFIGGVIESNLTRYVYP